MNQILSQFQSPFRGTNHIVPEALQKQSLPKPINQMQQKINQMKQKKVVQQPPNLPNELAQQSQSINGQKMIKFETPITKEINGKKSKQQIPNKQSQQTPVQQSTPSFYQKVKEGMHKHEMTPQNDCEEENDESQAEDISMEIEEPQQQQPKFQVFTNQNGIQKTPQTLTGYKPSPMVQQLQKEQQENQSRPQNRQYLVKRENGKFVSTKPLEERVHKKKSEQIWKPHFQIVTVNYPQLIAQIEGRPAKRKWQVDFQYLDNETGKKHCKRVRFGKNGSDDFIDHHDLGRKEKYLNTLRNPNNPFKANFWALQMLNTEDTLEKNYMNILKQL